MPEASPGAAEPCRKRERTMAALAYPMTWLTGLIVYVVADEEDRFARWHAIQAIGLGLGAALVSTLVGTLAALVAVVAFLLGVHPGPFSMATGILAAGVFGFLVPLAVLLFALVLASKAYHGDRPRLPIVAGLADTIVDAGGPDRARS